MIESIEIRLGQLEARNARVEADKAWETSWTRRLVLAVFTYITVGIFLVLIQVANPWVNALVPVIGFTISTLTVSVCKKTWLKRRKIDHSKYV